MTENAYFALPAETLDATPTLHPSAYLAPGAIVLGDVRLDAQTSIWCHAVLRGDINFIEIGARSNIQDGSVLHVENARPCRIGRDVVVGHMACLHACDIGDAALIGMGALILSGAVIGEGSLVAAGSLVLEKQVIEPGVLVAGRPAKVIRKLDSEAMQKHRALAAKYVALAALYREKNPRPAAMES